MTEQTPEPYEGQPDAGLDRHKNGVQDDDLDESRDD